MRDLLSRHIRRQLEGVKPPAKVQESGPNLVLTVADEKEKNTLVDQLTASVEDVVDLESERLQQPLHHLLRSSHCLSIRSSILERND